MNIRSLQKILPLFRRHALIIIPSIIFIFFGIAFYRTSDFNIMTEFKKNARNTDIREYTITVLPHSLENSMNVETKIKIMALHPVHEIYFLVGNSKINSIWHHNISLHFIKSGQILKVYLNHLIPRDTLIELTINSESHCDSILRKDGTIDSIVSSDYSIVRYQSGWYPRIPNDGAKSQLIIHSQKNQRVVANGKLVTRDEKELESVSTYFYPLDTRFTFIIDTYEMDAKAEENLTVELAYRLKNVVQMSELVTYVMDIINFYREILGNYPFDTLKVAISQEIYPGDRNCPHMIIIHENFLEAPPEEVAFFLAKEIAFQWFGTFIKTNEFSNSYYVRALALYLALMYSEVKEPKETFNKRLQGVRNLFFYHKEFNPDFDEPLRYSGDSNLILSKGVYIFHMVRYLLGDQNFYTLLAKLAENKERIYINRKSLGTHIHEITKKNYSWFFSEWEDREGAPAYEWRYGVEHDRITQNSILTLELSQDPVYKTPIPIRIMGDTTTIDKRISASERESSIRFEFPHPVKEVLFDPQMLIFRDNDERRLTLHEEEKIDPIKNALHRVIELGTVNPIETYLEMNSPFVDELYFNLNLLAHLKAKHFRIQKILALSRDKKGKNLEVIMGVATNSNRINETITLNLMNNFDSWKIYRMKYETL